MTSPKAISLQNNAAVLSICGEPYDGAAAALIQGLVDSASAIAITGHERPDGDCIGSEVALCSILRGLGKRTEIVNADPTPAKYAHLDPDNMIRQHRTGAPFGADLVFVVDSTDLKRIGPIAREDFGGAKIVDIDHHPGNPLFGEVNLVDTQAAAAAELIWRLASERRWPVPPLAREALYTGLVTDTGHFAYSNTTPRVLRMAAELRELGVDGEAVWRQIYLNKTRAELELEARARASMECHAKGRICLIMLRNRDFIETGTTPQNSEEFSGIPRMLAGVELAVFLYEINGGAATKASIRSTRNLDAGVLARSMGGGGHRQAAGCSFDLPVDAAKAVFLTAAEKLLAGEVSK